MKLMRRQTLKESKNYIVEIEMQKTLHTTMAIVNTGFGA